TVTCSHRRVRPDVRRALFASASFSSFDSSLVHLVLHSFPTRRSSDLLLPVLCFHSAYFQFLLPEFDEFPDKRCLIRLEIPGWNHAADLLLFGTAGILPGFL